LEFGSSKKANREILHPFTKNVKRESVLGRGEKETKKNTLLP